MEIITKHLPYAIISITIQVSKQNGGWFLFALSLKEIFRNHMFFSRKNCQNNLVEIWSIFIEAWGKLKKNQI